MVSKQRETWHKAKRVVSDSLGLVDFAIGLVNYVLNLTDGQVKIFPVSYTHLTLPTS